MTPAGTSNELNVQNEWEEKSERTSRPSERPPVRGEKMSIRLGETIGCKCKTGKEWLNPSRDKN